MSTRRARFIEVMYFYSNITDDRFNRIASFVWQAIDKYSDQDTATTTRCNSVYCRSQKMLKEINNKVTYRK